MPFYSILYLPLSCRFLLARTLVVFLVYLTDDVAAGSALVTLLRLKVSAAASDASSSLITIYFFLPGGVLSRLVTADGFFFI